MAGKQVNLNGWMTTKKKGRDDARIQRDKAKAIQAKKKQRKPSPSSAAAASRAKGSKKKRANDYSDDDDDDDESLEDFIVEDDDEEEEELNLNDDSEDDDEVIMAPRPRNRPTTASRSNLRKGKTVSISSANTSSTNNNDSDSDLQVLPPPSGQTSEVMKAAYPSVYFSSDTAESSDDEGKSTFLPMHKPIRTTKPSKALKYGSIHATQGKKAAPAKKGKRAPSQSASTSIFATEAVRKRMAAREYHSSDDDDGELTSPSPAMSKAKRKQSAGNKSSKYFASSATSGTTKMSLSTCMEEEADSPKANDPSQLIDLSQFVATAKNKPAAKSTSKKRTNKAIFLDTSDEDDIQPAKKATKKLANIKRKNMIIPDSSSDEDDSVLQVALRKSLKQSSGGSAANIAIEDDDDDEDAAIQWAIKDSKKEAKKLKLKSKEQPAAPMDIALAETSDEEDGDDDRDLGDEYNEGHKAATSVLETAEQLSAQVLRAMCRWNNNGSSKNNDGSAPGSAPQGMIVDGAVALSFSQKDSKDESAASDGTVNDNSQQHQWISQTLMRTICPHVTLSDYQLIGVNWLALLHGMRCSIEGKRDTNVNGILADEMGLGKTVQTITFLAWLKHQQQQQQELVDVDDDDDGGLVKSERKLTHLIVVPVSVMDNWMREFKTFCPDFNVVKFHGNLKERTAIIDDLRRYAPNGQYKSSTLDAILCPVTFFQKEKSDDRRFLMKFNFDYLVCDEAHLLKNAQSIRYRMLQRVRTRHRLLLTGTPVQNSPQELLNMLCFLMPLFSRATNDGFEEGGNENSASQQMLQHFVDEQSEGSGDEAAAYKKLKQLFAPFVLRRKKVEVLGQLIPPKERLLELVELDPRAREVYNSILADHVNKNAKKLSAAIGEHLFTNLRKAAHHPLLLRTRHTTPKEIEDLTTHFHKYGAFKGDGSTKARVAQELLRFSDFEIHLTALELISENQHRRPDLDRYILSENDLFCSSKFARLKKLLPDLISNDHRILIFSVWTTCLDLLSCLLESLHIKYVRMDGSCPSEMRQQLIDKFNEDGSISVFLLSTKACGVGINLTAADTCIMHDLDFNPFNDLQAEDRCHRIGQKKPVTIYKLVSQGTVDEDIYRMQERKSKMNAAIMESSVDKKERKEILQSAVQRFLSPAAKKKAGKGRKKKTAETAKDAAADVIDIS